MSSDRAVARCQFDTVQQKIVTTARLYPAAAADTRPFLTKALWDTGANASVITPYLANAMQLRIIDQDVVRGVTGSSLVDVTTVTMEIPGQGTYYDLRVLVCPFNADPESDVQMLIGMDIISGGDFVLSNGGDNTLFTFAFPASPDKIDLSKLP
jgi:hypothetical protein